MAHPFVASWGIIRRASVPISVALTALRPIGQFNAAAITGVILVMASAGARAEDVEAAQTDFDFKTSGYANLTAGGVGGEDDIAHRSNYGLTPEAEAEFTPQINTGATKFAVRAVVNGTGLSTERGDAWRVAIPELSAFAIGDFGRIEFGERSGFPQSLVGFTPSEIAFTAAEFGPDSGRRLDPNGGLPTAFLDPALGARINALTYLGYTNRFYDNESPKIIYLSPRFENGLYGAVSFTPQTIEPGGFDLARRQGPTGSSRYGRLVNTGSPDDVVQAALVYNYRDEGLDLSAGVTYSHASAGGDAPSVLRGRDISSLSSGISVTIDDTWALGASFTYDGFTAERGDLTAPLRSAPYGVVTSVNYVDGPWVVGGYYQHATAASPTIEPRRDTVEVFEVGASYLIDQDHDLIGAGHYTDVKLFTSVYSYKLNSDGVSGTTSLSSNGVVVLAGIRFSFF